MQNINNWEEFCEKNQDKKIAFLTAGIISETIPNNLTIFNLSEQNDLDEVARKLYNTLFEIDNLNFDEIIFKYFPESQLGSTINDRLTRASNK